MAQKSQIHHKSIASAGSLAEGIPVLCRMVVPMMWPVGVSGRKGWRFFNRWRGFEWKNSWNNSGIIMEQSWLNNVVYPWLYNDYNAIYGYTWLYYHGSNYLGSNYLGWSRNMKNMSKDWQFCIAPLIPTLPPGFVLVGLRSSEDRWRNVKGLRCPNPWTQDMEQANVWIFGVYT